MTRKSRWLQMAVPAKAPRSLAALAGIALLAFSMQASGQQAARDDSRETLGPGDTVRITVFQNPDLTTEARVSERGTIVFPLIGET
jgi:polysaccharide export outer membrane protein